MQKMIEQELLQQATDKWAEIKNKDPNELIKSLDIISELLLHPKLTLKIAESLRPILIDLVSRWSLQLNIDNYNNTKSNQLFSNKEYFLRIEKVALAFTQLLPITPQLLSIVYNMSVTQQEIALEYWTCSSKSHHIINYLELENGEIIDVRMLRLFDEISNAKKQHSLLLDCENNNNNVLSLFDDISFLLTLKALKVDAVPSKMQKMIEQELLQQATDKWAEIKNKDPNELIKSLDIISELLLHPKLTLKIAESLRPILIDLVSRWSLQLNIDNYNNTKSNQLFSNKEYFLRIEKVALAFTQLLPITPQLLSIVYNMSVTQQEIALEYWTCSSKSHHIINYLELENGEIIDVRMLRLFDEISNAKKQHSLLLDCENNNNNVFSISS
ncbi:13154_t:CDS:2, partial [Entrophospora sp. SA101]